MTHPVAVAVTLMLVVIWGLYLALSQWGPASVRRALDRAGPWDWVGLALFFGAFVALALA